MIKQDIPEICLSSLGSIQPWAAMALQWHLNVPPWWNKKINWRANHPHSQLRAELRWTRLECVREAGMQGCFWVPAKSTHYDHRAQPRSKVSGFSWGRKIGWSGKPLWHSREPTHNSAHIYGPGLESNRGHLGERRGLSAQANHATLNKYWYDEVIIDIRTAPSWCCPVREPCWGWQSVLCWSNPWPECDYIDSPCSYTRLCRMWWWSYSSEPCTDLQSEQILIKVLHLISKQEQLVLASPITLLMRTAEFCVWDHYSLLTVQAPHFCINGVSEERLVLLNTLRPGPNFMALLTISTESALTEAGNSVLTASLFHRLAVNFGLCVTRHSTLTRLA